MAEVVYEASVQLSMQSVAIDLTITVLSYHNVLDV